MKELFVWFQAVITVIGGYVGHLLGGVDSFLYALMTFVVLDYITGVLAGIVQKKLSSEIGFKGIISKVCIFVMVAVAHIIDANILGDGAVVRTAVIFFYCSNEGISILENAGIIGLPIPNKLKDILEQIRDKENNHD